MLLYSIASGVSCVGVLLIIYIAMLMFVINAFSGFAMTIFKFNHQVKWSMIFLATFAVFGTIAGITTVITLGYQPVDLFVVVITILGSCVATVLLTACIEAISQHFAKHN